MRRSVFSANGRLRVKMLGHARLNTTEIYTHVLNRGGLAVRSGQHLISRIRQGDRHHLPNALLVIHKKDPLIPAQGKRLGPPVCCRNAAV